MLRPYGKARWRTRLILGLTLVISGILVIYTDSKLASWCGGGLSLGGILMLVQPPRTRLRPGAAFITERKRFKLMVRKPRIVVIGGGTGLGAILRGLKNITDQLTAIVTVADDGGSSGWLRKEFGILPPGDIRNCLIAMADLEPLMEQLMQFRFNGRSGLAGHSFGNLFLTAMTAITGDFQKAIEASVKVLAVKGKIFAATLDNVNLRAELQDGAMVNGESTISQSKAPIKRVYLEPTVAKAVPESLHALAEADLIIIGPGSLFTSVIPPLLVKEILAGVKASTATKIYICNVMTQPGETDGFSAAAHLQALLAHTDRKLVDYMIINDQPVPLEAQAVYAEEGAEPVRFDQEQVAALGVRPITAPLLNTNGLVRHDADRLAKLLVELLPTFLGRRKRWRRNWQRWCRILGQATALKMASTIDGGPTGLVEAGKALQFDFIAKNLTHFKTPSCAVYTKEEEAPTELLPYHLDYEKKLVIGVFLGERPYGGYGLSPREVLLKKGKVEISYRLEEPLRSGVVQRLTYPAAFFILDRGELPSGELAVFIKEESSQEPVLVSTLNL